MAVLQNMREKFGIAISIIIALSLLYFIAPINDLMTLFGRPQNVGEIAGKGVSYEDFMEQVDKYTTIYEMQTGSSVQNEQSQQQIRENAWQEFVNNYMFIKNAKAAGITVGDKEIVDLTTGDTPSPIVTSAFESNEDLVNFVQNLDSDNTGNYRTFWNYLQNTVYTQQFYAKYAALFNASSIDNKLVAEAAIAENNSTASIDYVLARYPFAKDSSVVVSADAIKNYYNNHKDFFKQLASRDVEYVVFEVIPSAEDIAAVNESMAAVYDEFTTTDNMKAFLLKNSDSNLSNYWYKASELSTLAPELAEFAETAAVGAVSPIVTNGNTFYAVRIMDQANMPDNITVKAVSANGATEITPELLETLEATEPMNMTQSYIIPGCEVLFNAPLNTPQIIPSAQYGNILAKVIEAGEPVVKKQVAILEKTAVASNDTYNKYYNEANNFAVITGGTYEGYKKALDTTKVYSHPMNVTEATSTYGSIDQAKEVTRWIFDNKAGKASNIITVSNNYFFIVAVKGINKEGYAPLNKVSASIESKLYADAMHEKVAADYAAKIAGKSDLNEIAEVLGGTVQSADGVSFSSTNLEPALVGAVAVAPENKVVGPVAGQMGVYVFQVNAREDGAFFTAEDAKNLAAQKAQYASQFIIPAMMENADVKDNRARFF